uniref:DDE Tnp4 domain-containing protein n=1 Tax=Cyprinus carpio TaxID=7962 RepID=A0A8C1UT45_CYPCA
MAKLKLYLNLPLFYMLYRLGTTVPVMQRYFGGEDTRPDFRLGREAIQQLTVALKTDRQHGWGPTLETLVFLFWLATGSAYRVVSRVFSMPLPTVHRVVHKMVDEVVAVLPQFVHFPPTQEELQVVGDGFARLANHQAFGKTAGAVDGCHIRIKCPGGPDGHDYKNRKLFPSVVLQAVCDHQGRFIDIFVGYPGSVHDARILKNSPIYTRGTYPPPGYFLLADGGYPCLQEPLALITPCKRPVRGMAEQRFNYHHSKGRTIIERAFGMMKTRFRCIFLEALEVHTLFVPKVVTACVILHNICVGVGDVLEEVVEEEDNQPPGELDGGESQSGAAWRAALTNEVSALHEAPLDHDYFCQP